MVIGQDQDSVGGGFDPQQRFIGSLDELSVWNRELTPAEVAALVGQAVPSNAEGILFGYSFEFEEILGVRDYCPDDIRDVARNQTHLDAIHGACDASTTLFASQAPGRITGGSYSAATGIGDFDGDGLDDAVVIQSSNGRAVIVYGGALPSSNVGTLLQLGLATEINGVQSAASVQAIGDVNADGLSDFLITAPEDIFDAGSAYVIYGRTGIRGQNLNLSSLPEGAGVHLVNPTPNRAFGRLAAGLGDVNGDGISDFLVATSSFGGTTTQVMQNPGFNAIPPSAGWTTGSGWTFMSNEAFWTGTGFTTIAQTYTLPSPLPAPIDRATARVEIPEIVAGISTTVFVRLGLAYTIGGTTFESMTQTTTSAGVLAFDGDLHLPSDTTSITLRVTIQLAGANNLTTVRLDNATLTLTSGTTAEAYVFYGSAGGLGVDGTLDVSEIGGDVDRGLRGTRIINVPNPGSASGVGDFDGDGFNDIAFISNAFMGPRGGIVYGGLRDTSNGIGIGQNGILNFANLQPSIGGQVRRFGTRFITGAGTGNRAVARARGVGIGDITGDGRGDLAISESTAIAGLGQRQYILAGRSGRPATISNITTSATSVELDRSFNAAGLASAAGDYDGDGRMDLALSNGFLNQVSQDVIVRSATLPPNTTTGLFNVPPFQTLLSDNPNARQVYNPLGDFTGNGHSDVIVNAFGTIGILPGTPPGFTPAQARGYLPHGMGGNPSGVLPIYNRVPAQPVGTVANGSSGRASTFLSIGFRGGEAGNGTQLPSQQTVTMHRTAPPKPFRVVRSTGTRSFASLPRYWRIQTNRINFTEANLTFNFSRRDIAGYSQEELELMGVFYTPNDPADSSFDPSTWQPLRVGSIDLQRGRITVRREFTVDEDDVLKVRREFEGYYAIFIGNVRYELGEEIVPSVAVNLDALPAGGPIVEPLGATFWHQGTRKLYAAQPFAAVSIRWVNQNTPAAPPMETTVASFVWPGKPNGPLSDENRPLYDRHVLNTPAIPLDGRNNAGVQIQSVQLLMTETDANAGIVGANKSFTATSAGRSLLLLSTGTNPFVDPIYFQYVWSMPYSQPGLAQGGDVTVGTDIGKWGQNDLGLHTLDAGEPYFMNTLGMYNPQYYNRALAPRTGPLIPVNTLLSDSTPEEAFQVVFYERTRRVVDPLNRTTPQTFKIYWPASPFNCDVRWPTDLESPDPIVIASQIGSGPLLPTTYKTPSIYFQNVRRLPGPDGEFGTADDVTLLGYNPNEEHALLIDQGNGLSAFALRDDLATPETSEPFVLVSYLNAQERDRPAMKLFRVVKTDALNDFFYETPPAVAGNRVEPPFPLRSALFPSCPPTEPGALDGNYTITPELIFQDRTGAFWVTSADGTGIVTMRYFYRLRDGFYMPEDYKEALRATDIYTDEEAFNTGVCIPWLDVWKDPALAGTPIDVSFTVEWPADAPTLFAAETLIRPKRGLPGIQGADSVDIAYDQSQALGGGRSAILIDPTRDRFVPFRFNELSEKDTFLGATRMVRVGGLLEFEEIVPHIRRRLKWDDNAGRLIWRGQNVTFVTGEDMLLPNVMTSRERDAILELSDNALFRAAVESLYQAASDVKLVQPTAFTASAITDTAISNRTAAVPADVDRDGDFDIFAVEDGALVLYENRLNEGEDWVRRPISVTNFAGQVTHMRAGDLSLDQRDDIVIATNDTGRNLFLLVAPTSITGPWQLRRITGQNIPDLVDIQLVDIDRDGDLDVMVVQSQFIRWFRFANTSGETWDRFEILENVPVSGAHAAMFAGSIFPEVVYGRSDNGQIHILRNRSTVTSFSSAWQRFDVDLTNGSAPRAFATADVNADGLLDIVSASSGNGRILLHLNEGTAAPGGPFRTTRLADGFIGVDSIAIADIDNDGDRDVVAASSANGIIRWFESNGLSPLQFQANSVPSVFPTLSAFRLADINGDGNIDIVPGVFDGSGDEPASIPGIAWFESDGSSRDVFDSLALTSAIAQGEGFMTLVFNNADFSTGAVTVEVIRVSCPLYRGDVKVIYPDCPFNERVALRHNGDFAGQADKYEFRWRYAPAPIFLQILADTGGPPNPNDLQIWTDFPGSGPGAVDIAVQDPSGELILSDLFWIVSYRPYAPAIDPSSPPVCDAVQWSEWTGAGLTEGWVKRVIGDFGPFRQRATGGGIQGAEDNFVDFGNRTINTIVSMISQAGERWEGNVPLSCGSVDELGLIETYQSVLNRAKALSIEAAPRRDLDQFIEVFDDQGNLVSRTAGKDGVPDAGASAGVSNALLLAAARIADLYTLIANEAFADASDPTIAFGTDDGVFGPVATSIHPFMNQTATLLEEELKLLRGRDASSLPSVRIRPVYNRLIWNFTNDFVGGEVAYALNYGIGDVNVDGVIDEVDAKQLFPQGHGDAWGHQLTALKAYYNLITEPEFAWVPRTEPVLVGGSPVEVDYFDERKFATLAANFARTGREVVSLTYRDVYTENPSQQFRGYKDTNPDRAWGLAEWGGRSGMGAYFNWVTANALLPPDNGSVPLTSIRKIDRAAVPELREIAAAAVEIQKTVDDADAGLNPLGIAANTIPFDISPVLLTTEFEPRTHFEQVYERTLTALANAKRTFDFAAAATIALRRQADQVSDFQTAVEDQEIDYKFRLIEVFGTPYPDDIGPGRTYRQGYDGPDLIHWAYFDPPQLADNEIVDFETREVKGYIRKDLNFLELLDGVSFDFTDDELSDVAPAYGNNLATVQSVGTTVEFTYHISEKFGQTRPASWTADRRVYGKIQLAQLELFQAITQFKKAVDNYDGFILELEDKLRLLELKYNVKQSQITVKRTARDTGIAMDILIFTSKTLSKVFGATKETTKDIAEAATEAVPKVVGFSNDVTSPVRAVINISSTVTSNVLAGLEIAADLAAEGFDIIKNQVDKQAELSVEVIGAVEEIEGAIAEIRTHLLNDTTLRFEILIAEQEIQQKAAAWTQALAEGERLLEERARFRRKTAGRTQNYRYKDMAFRIFRNESVQKYRAALDLAARFVYLTAKAYDYETNLLSGDGRGAGDQFLTAVVKARTVGLVSDDGTPQIGQINGDPGLADAMARMRQNWDFALRSQLGFNNPQTETNRFSLRRELFRIGLSEDADINPDIGDTDEKWREILSRPFGPNSSGIVRNVFALPEFRRYAIPFTSTPDNPLLANEPAIVIRFGTNVNFAQNFFVNLDSGQAIPLGAGDSSYDTTAFATKIRSVGLWFSDYNALVGGGMSNTPRVYLIPVGRDLMRSSSAERTGVRAFRIVEQAIPAPFPLSGQALNSPTWSPVLDTLSEGFIRLRRYPSFRAYHTSGGFDNNEPNTNELSYDSRLIGRSVWNTEWYLIIPGGTLHSNRDEGIRRFIWGRLGRASDGTFVLDDQGRERDGKGVSDIRLFFQTYAYTGSF